MLHHYILDDEHRPVKASLMRAARWFEADFKRRVVAQDDVGGLFVSTVFLGLDHRRGGKGPPILFETMVFSMSDGGKKPLYGEPLDQLRYASWDDAETGHKAVVRRLQATLSAAFPSSG